MAASIAGRGLRMAFGGVEVVRGVDLDLHPGEVHAIVGENGAGKSTVAKILAGVHRPTGGEVLLKGQPVRLENPRHAIHLGVALIHQEPLTFPDLDVAENVFVGHQLLRPRGGIDWPRMRERTREILDSLGVRLDLSARVGSLSVADQQMVELASALSHDARILLFDETTASLTPKEVDELFAIMRRLRDEGAALAFVSHRLDEVFAIADRITVMRDGDKVAELKPAESTVGEVVRLMVGRDAAESGEGRSTVSDAKPILQVQGLTLAGSFADIDLDVRPGEIVGLAGLVGAGRTEVVETIFGARRPTAGEVQIGGRPVRPKSPRQGVALGMALVPEDRQHHGLLLPMTVTENATLAVLSRLAQAGWRRPRREREAARTTFEALRLAKKAEDPPVSDLSGGNQQKVVLAKWLLSEPKVLILDEPTRGVDVGAKAEVHRLVRELAGRGIAILVVSSDLPEVLSLCDRIGVMREGRLAAWFDRADATPEGVMLAATGQVAA